MQIKPFRRFVALAFLLSGPTLAFGQLIPFYETPRRVDYAKAEEAFKNARMLEDAAAGVNSVVRLPTQVAFVLRECGTANAFFDPRQQAIFLCYELLDQVVAGITRDFGQAPTKSKMDSAFGAIYFIVFHEMGHALSHILHLPILGKEEDAADSIATYILLNLRNSQGGVIGAVWFFTNAASQPTLRDFADEHSLGPQRAYSLLCKALGKDPSTYAELAARFQLPRERAQRCSREYAQLKESVRDLLGEHLVLNNDQ